MKQMKFLAITFILLMGVAVTSCMDSDNGDSADTVTYVTVLDNSIYGGVTLLTDDGYYLVPTNSEVLKVSTTEYAKRVLVGVKWSEGVVFDGDRNKKYGMSIVAPLMGIPAKTYCNAPDTIENSYPIVGLNDNSLWGANGNYLTVGFTFNYQNSSAISFDLLPYAAEGDKLTMKLCQSVGSKNAYDSQDYLMSFELPSSRTINELLQHNEGIQGIKGGELTVPANDTISVKIIADGTSSSELETKYVKMKIRR